MFNSALAPCPLPHRAAMRHKFINCYITRINYISRIETSSDFEM